MERVRLLYMGTSESSDYLGKQVMHVILRWLVYPDFLPVLPVR